MEIRLKPITADSWSGIDRYPGCNEVLRPYWTRSGSIYTGLTREDEKRLGEELGVDLRRNSKFWNEFMITIGKSTVVLDIDKPEDELKYLFLKSHKRVKESIKAHKPSANYYLHNPDEEATIFNEINRDKRRAYKEFDKMKPADWRKALRLYGDNASNNVSDSVVEDRLAQRIEQNPKHFFKIWVDNKHRATEFLIKEAIAAGEIRKNKNVHSFGTTTLGNTLEDAIFFIDNPENSDIKAAIINGAHIK